MAVFVEETRVGHCNQHIQTLTFYVVKARHQIGRIKQAIRDKGLLD